MKKYLWRIRLSSSSIPVRPFLLLLVLGLLPVLLAQASSAATTTFYLPLVRSDKSITVPIPQTGPAYGVNFMTSAEQQADAQQFQNGVSTGAGWNRWPVYWFHVETSPDVFDWADQDNAAQGDVDHGWRTNAILLGTPGFYLTALRQPLDATRPDKQGPLSLEAVNTATPQGLYQSIFSDGSDVPGPGKQINSNNKWARYVHTAVNRYKPGGVLAQQRGWGTGVGITHWEIWNEPDLAIFWDGTLADYARLLKVGYLSAKQADPHSVILFAGLANDSRLLGYYDDVLDIYDNDPLAASHGYYHDIMATHSYFYAWQSWYHVFRAANTMGKHGLDKPIWLNESGVAVWNDYPGPVWDSSSSFRATATEQADYIIQSAFYAMFAGADAIFHFQLYDGCGNQPAFTDFPPHNGELCDASGYIIGQPGMPCAGDANGLYSNPSDATCFTQHPQPESARPSLAAYQVLTTYVNDVYPYWRKRPGDPKCTGPGGIATPGQEWIAYYQPSTRKRIVGMWALCADAETAVIDAKNPAGTAWLVGPDGSVQTISASNGVYTIQLPGATNRNRLGGSVPAFYPIGGRPFILVEPDPGGLQ